MTDYERHVLDSDAFQRQRGIKQLGTSMLIYPSAVQTRFVHALGNLQIIGEMYEAAIRNSEAAVVEQFYEAARAWIEVPGGGRADHKVIAERLWQVVRIAGMCHDLGHLPLSHVLEYAIKAAVVERRVAGPDYAESLDKPHEYATRKLIEDNGVTDRNLFLEAWLQRAVLDVITMAQRAEDSRTGHPVACALADLVSSEVDSDRAEYLRRDNYVSGAGYGQYDIERIINSLVLVETENKGFRIRPSARALQAVEAFLLERVRSHQHLYYHPVGVLMDAIVTAILRSAFRGEALQSVRRKRNRRLQDALDVLKPEHLHYKNLVAPDGYIDDAHIWEYLRSLLRFANLMPPEPEEREYRRLRAYLSVLLRREHLWVSLWKRSEDFAEASQVVFEGFCNTLTEVHKIEIDDAVRGSIRQRMAGELENLGRVTRPEHNELSCLNYLAHRHKSRLLPLGPILEKLLDDDPELKALATPFFVEIGMREFFRPLKTPRSYSLVAKDGRPRPFFELAPASVRAVENLWFEGIQIRMYVICECELRETESKLVRTQALRHLGTAVGQWYQQEGINFYAKKRA